MIIQAVCKTTDKLLAREGCLAAQQAVEKEELAVRPLLLTKARLAMAAKKQ